MANIPNPSGAIIYFMIITLFFIFGIVYSILQTKTIQDASFSIDNNINNSVYLLFLVLGSYFINIVTLKAMCSGSGMEFQWGYIALITLLPWVIIFVSLYFILKIFPGWASPFSNTIGYGVIGLLGVEKIYESIFKTTEEANENTELVRAIANINSNRGKFVNQISINVTDFTAFFNNMGEAIKTDNENLETSKLKLYQLLVIKQFVGKIVWYILAGILICSISYNLIISMTCEKSLAQIEKDFENITAEQSVNPPSSA
jgi:hypothetical protein